jgi:hypothetical protein
VLRPGSAALTLDLGVPRGGSTSLEGQRPSETKCPDPPTHRPTGQSFTNRPASHATEKLGQRGTPIPGASVPTQFWSGLLLCSPRKRCPVPIRRRRRGVNRRRQAGLPLRKHSSVYPSCGHLLKLTCPVPSPRRVPRLRPERSAKEARRGHYPHRVQFCPDFGPWTKRNVSRPAVDESFQFLALTPIPSVAPALNTHQFIVPRKMPGTDPEFLDP